MSISLCMIVKNEERNLDRCLSSVRDFVDEIIVVDTGSTDGTEKVAKSFGAKIYHHRWNNSFADARNYSLLKATEQWILIMDADDEFEREDKEKLLRITKNRIGGPNVYCGKTLCYSGNVPDNNNVLINLNVRLIRNKAGYKYEGRIHEQIVLKEEDINSPYPIVAADIRFHHYGYLTSYITEKDKHNRNIALIQKELDENPENAFMLFNMGNEYYAMQDIEKSLDFYMRSFKNADLSLGYSPVLLIRIVMCNEALHMDTALFKFVKLGLQYYPYLTDFEFLKATALLRLKKMEAAIRSYKKCIKMGSPATNINSILGVGTFKPHYALSTIYSKLGDYAKAEWHCSKALKYNPTFRIAYSELIDLLKAKGKPVKSIKTRLAKMIPHNANSFLMLSDLFYARKYYSEAYALALQAQEFAPENPLIYFYEGMCKFYLRKYKQAYFRLLKVDGIPFQSKSALIRLLCITFDKRIVKFVPQNFQSIIDQPYYKAAMAYRSLILGESCELLAENVEESRQYIKPIFELLEILLKTAQLENFKNALPILNLITNDGVLLILGKMYYRNGYARLAYHELTRSIKLTDKIDAEGLEIMKATIAAANS